MTHGIPANLPPRFLEFTEKQFAEHLEEWGRMMTYTSPRKLQRYLNARREVLEKVTNDRARARLNQEILILKKKLDTR